MTGCMHRVAAFAALLCLVLAAVATTAGAMGWSGAMKEEPSEELRLTLDLRDLWSGHIFWTRSFVLATHYADPAAARAADDEAKANIEAFSGFIASYYEDSAERLGSLMTTHYDSLKDYAYASFAGDAEARRKAAEALAANSDDMAAFFASLNPHFDEQVLRGLFSTHMDGHMAQIDLIAKEDFAAEADAWREMRSNAYAIADAMSDAITKHFPAGPKRGF